VSLVDQFKEAVASLTFYLAAEGEQWKREADARREATYKLLTLKRQMLETYGRTETQRIINSLEEHLCFTELQLP
jgi:hypothetical protein